MPSLKLFLAAVLAPLLFWGAFPPAAIESTDYLSFYHPVAESWVQGTGLVTPEGTPAVRYPPGFPAVLAAMLGLAQVTGTPEAAWTMGFIFLSYALSAILLFQLFRLALPHHLAQFAAWLWPFYPFCLWLTRQPNSELAFMPLLYGALLILGHLLWRQAPLTFALGAGVLLGVAALVRPIAIALPLVLAAFYLGIRWREKGRAWAIAALLLIGFLLPVAPWEAWAHRETGRWIPLSTGGPYSLYDGLTFPLETKGYRTPLAIPDATRRVVEAAIEQREPLLQGGHAAFMLEQVQKNPLGVAQLAGLKLARAWYGTDAQHASETVILLMQAMLALAALWGTRRLWQQGGKAREWGLFSGLLVLYFWGMASIALPLLRYLVPALALLFPAVVLSCSEILDKRRLKSSP